MTTFSTMTPRPVTAPRGAVWAAAAFGSLMKFVARVQVARAERRQRVQRWNEANEVRLHAAQVTSWDPRFAADLMAAADRHDFTR